MGGKGGNRGGGQQRQDKDVEPSIVDVTEVKEEEENDSGKIAADEQDTPQLDIPIETNNEPTITKPPPTEPAPAPAPPTPPPPAEEEPEKDDWDADSGDDWDADSDAAASGPGTQLFVGNLSWDTNWTDL